MRERRGPVVADRQGCPGSAKGLVIGEDRLHVVFGTGQVGSALAAHLAGLGMAVRAAMTAELLAAAGADRVRLATGPASDFFGPGVTQGSTLGERVFGNALAGRRADYIGNPDLPHAYSYLPDIAAGLATLGTDARAAGQVWHLPGRRPSPPGHCWTWWSAPTAP